MSINWVELGLALLIASACLGGPVLIVMVLLDLSSPKRRERKAKHDK